MIINRVNSSWALACLLLVVSSSPLKAETLEAAVVSAFSNHPAVASAQAMVNAAGQEKKAEVSGYFPTVSASATAGRLFVDNITSRGFNQVRGEGYSGFGEGSVSARQMIFDGFETKSRVSAADARLHSADMAVLDAREGLALRTTEAYLNLLRAQKGAQMLQAHKAKVVDYLDRIKLAVDNGAADESEYQLARDVKVILDGFVTDYQGQVRAAQANYHEAVGRMPEEDMFRPQPQLDLIPADTAEAITAIERSHPLIKAALYQSKSAEYDISSEEASLYPDLDGELSYLKNDREDIVGGEAIDARAVLRLNWEFDTGGGQLARIKQRKFEHNEARARVRETKRQIANQIRLAYSELQTAQDQLQHQKSRLDLNTKLFDTYKVQFEGARITLLQLMQADNQLFNTELEKLNGEYRVLAAQYHVLASMGRLQDSLVMASSNAGPAQHEQK